MTFDELCESLLKLSFDEKVELGKQSISTLREALVKQGLKREDVAGVIKTLIRLSVSGDVNCTEDEWKLYNAIFDVEMTFDDFFQMTNKGANPAFIAATDMLVDAFDAETKTAAVTLIGVFLAADDVMTPNEMGLLARLIIE